MSAWSVEVLDVALDSATATAPQVHACPQWASAKTFLQSRPSGGVYTCARASAIRSGSRYELVLWQFHLERLAAGIRAIGEDHGDDWVGVMQQVTTTLSEGVIEYGARRNRPLEDLMVTVMWWSEPAMWKGYSISVHACVMPTPKNLLSTVLVHGDGRENAVCKHTKWIADRVPLEEHTTRIAACHGPIHETILSRYDAERDDKVLLEGLVTNFFVVKQGRVCTAKDDVLLGSTRALVLQACEDLGIPVVLEAPRFSERSLWDAAFVTSAVRLAVSVTRIVWESSGEEQIQELQLAGSSEIVERIRRRIVDRQYFLGE